MFFCLLGRTSSKEASIKDVGEVGYAFLKQTLTQLLTDYDNLAAQTSYQSDTIAQFLCPVVP